MTHCIYELLQPDISSQVAESPAADLLASCKSRRCCIFIGATPSIFGPNCSLHPNIWLSYPAKMASQYMGFMQLDHPIAGYRAM